MKSIIILIAFIGIGVEVVQGEDGIPTFECEGKDASNYTYIKRWTVDQTCSLESYKGTGTEYLIQQNDQKALNVLKVLATSHYPAGELYQYETLYLIVSGNLEGKFVYLKEIGLVEAYLKRCSSVLGYSYTSTKSQVLLIADKLDPNVLISPTGGFDQFKKFSTSICHGKTIIV